MDFYEFNPLMKLPYNGAVVGIEAQSFQSYIDQYHPLKDDTPIALGEYQYLLKEMPLEHRINRGGQDYVKPAQLAAYQGRNFGFVQFSDVVNIPVLQTTEDVWMSLTPMEVMTCRPGIRKAWGRVLLGGLGIGYMAQCIAQKKTVKAITVIERSQPLIDFFSPILQAKHPKIKWEFICGDAWIEADKMNLQEYNSVLYDIWEGFGAAYNCPQWEKLQARAIAQKANTWAWGDIQHRANGDPFRYADLFGWRAA